MSRSSAFDAALNHARQRLNTHAGVPLEEWCAASVACASSLRRFGIEDQAVMSAGVLGRYLSAASIDSETVTAFRPVDPGADRDGLAASARRALAVLTHGAATTATGPTEVLLRAQGVALLERQTSPIDVAVHRWADTALVFRHALGSAGSAAIANYQVAVLKETLRLASAVAVDPELDEVFRRWQAAATTETARWAQIATNSAAEHVAQHGATPGAVATENGHYSLAHLYRSVSALQRAILNEPSSAEALAALTRSLPAANLTVELAFAEQGSTSEPAPSSRALCDGGVVLAQARSAFSDRTAPDPSAEPEHHRHHEHHGRREAGTHGAVRHEATDADGALASTQRREAVWGDTNLRLTPESEVEFGRQMDAGAIAQAALQGVAAAVAVVGGSASVAELEALVMGGRQARAQLLASVAYVPAHYEGRRAGRYSEDRVQWGREELAACLDRWDSNQLTWVSWAFMHARYAYLKYRDELTQGRTYAVEDDYLERLSGASVALVEDEIMSAAEAAELRSLLASLPTNEANAVFLRMGFDGAPRTLSEVGSDLGVSVATTTRWLDHGIEKLQAAMLTSRADRSTDTAPGHGPAEEIRQMAAQMRATSSTRSRAPQQRLGDRER